VGAQNVHNWTASIVIGIEPKSAQTGGTARHPEILSDQAA
jgi:hypothetical protein